MKINSNYFKKKNIIITGANQGLGLEMAKHFYKLGANIIICARNNEKLKNVKKILKKNKAQIIIIEKCDVSKFKQVDLFFDRIIKKIKKIDILINNAGIYGPKGEIEDLSWKDFKKTFEINLFGSIYLIKKVIPHFKKYNKGKIVQMSGGGAASPLPYFSAYATSKAGIVRFIENISKELESYKIDINAVAPGPVWNELLERAHAGRDKEEMQEYYRESQPMKFLGDSSDVANGILYLASDAARYVTGTIFRIDAGRGAD